MNEPPWVESLRQVDVEAMGLRWFSDEEAVLVRDAWSRAWRGMPYNESFVADGLARIERCKPLLLGPQRSRRLSKRLEDLVVVLDPDEAESDVAWLSLAGSMPPQAWADAKPDAEGLGAALAAYAGATDRDVADFQCEQILVKTIEIDGPWVIQENIAALEPWMDDAFWGSASVHDPYESLAPDAGVFGLRLILERVGEQHQGRAPSISVRSLWSRSILTIEQHAYGFWRFVLRYTPFDNRRAIEKLGGVEPGSRFPADLPVDLASSMLRGPSLSREGLNRDLATASSGDMLALWLLEGDLPATLDTLRRTLALWRGEERRLHLIDVCGALGLDGLLREVALDEGDSELGAQIREMFSPKADESESEEDPS